MMDHAIVEELDQVLVVPNQVFDDRFGAPGLGVGAIPSAVLGDRSYDVAEESAVVSQDPLQKGCIVHGDSPFRKRGRGLHRVRLDKEDRRCHARRQPITGQTRHLAG